MLPLLEPMERPDEHNHLHRSRTIGTNTSAFDGIDNIGIFGPAGASLVGQHFTTVFTGSDCNCTGGISLGGEPFGEGFNPVQDAILTINGITYHFGPGLYGEMHSNSFQQVNVDAFTVISINPGGLGMGTGEFRISAGANGAGAVTSGFFIGESISNSLNVPGPVVGADLSSLLVVMLIIFGGFYWKRRTAVG